MTLDVRTSTTQIENIFRDQILYALGARRTVSTIADLRDVSTRGDVSSDKSDDDLMFVSGTSTAYRWFSESTANDDGSAVIKPNDVRGNGRWQAWTSPLRLAPTVGGDSVQLDQITAGPLRRVQILDRPMSVEELTNLFAAEVPAVAIVALGDDPEELQPGYRYNTPIEFEVSIIAENLRDRRQAAQGSALEGELGANGIDGLIKSLLAGTTLSAVEENIRNVQLGKAHNWVSDLAQRRVIRSRIYTVKVTEIYPNAPNEIGPAQEITLQAQLSALDENNDDFDSQNYLQHGAAVPFPVSGLTQSVSAGSAVIGGVSVTYAGESHAFDAWADVYRDLLPNGTMTFISVGAANPEPPVTANALRIGRTRTDGADVIEDVILCATSDDYGPTYHFVP